VFDAVHHALVGERSGRRFRLGDPVRVQVARVDLDDRKIDFEMAADTPQPAAAERQVSASRAMREKLLADARRAAGETEPRSKGRSGSGAGKAPASKGKGKSAKPTAGAKPAGKKPAGDNRGPRKRKAR